MDLLLLLLAAGISPLYASIFVISMLFPALDTIYKERVFRCGAGLWRVGGGAMLLGRG